MGIVLVIVGIFLYAGLSRALDDSIDAGLRARAGDVAALVRQADSGLREGGGTVPADGDESLAQVLDPSGAVVDSTPLLAGDAVLTATQLLGARTGAVVFDRATVTGLEEPARLLAVPVEAQDRTLIVVVGTSLERHDETLSQLLAQLLLGGPIALLLTALLAYELASAALRPVESMRREALVISAAEPGRRLPVPPAKDELARLSATLNDMLARLEAAMAKERSFVSDASHELRTPLALLKTELELALSHERPAEELRAALRSAAAETDRLTQLAEDLLVLARFDQGRLAIRGEPIAAGHILDDVRERFAGRAVYLGRDISATAPSDLTVVADRIRLEQALSNLVENALRHGAGHVSLVGETHHAAAEIHVLDRGPGFAPDFLPRAFERFTRSDEARSGGGAGLGLAIAAVIVQAHGGTIRAGNRGGGGADVCISLPLPSTRPLGSPTELSSGTHAGALASAREPEPTGGAR
ncbi:MAG: sensor histidine kinase [Thermoleophilia bacterium]